MRYYTERDIDIKEIRSGLATGTIIFYCIELSSTGESKYIVVYEDRLARLRQPSFNSTLFS